MMMPCMRGSRTPAAEMGGNPPEDEQDAEHDEPETEDQHFLVTRVGGQNETQEREYPDQGPDNYVAYDFLHDRLRDRDPAKTGRSLSSMRHARLRARVTP
jgi:hypothetical protein